MWHKCRQKENDADQIVSLAAGILDLDLFADQDEDNDVMTERAAGVTASHAAAADDDDEHRFAAAATRHQSPSPSTADPAQ